MKILGVDQSLTSTGWSVLDNGVLISSGLLTSNKNLTNFERAIEVADQIHQLVQDHDPHTFILEGLPFMSMSNVTRDLAGLQFLIIDRLLRHLHIEGIKVVPPTQLKKFATGSGKASKEEMYEALPIDIKNKFSSVLKTKGRYDLTDSYWLASFGTVDINK